MSLDGFIAGPNVSTDQPMGRDGYILHGWLLAQKTEADMQLVTELVESSGAVIVGGWTYTVAINGVWEQSCPFTCPAFVLCSESPPAPVEGFTFVTDGISAILSSARSAAGVRNIWIMGGANTAQQFLKAGLIDELHLHIAPVLLGRGTRLFERMSNQVELEKVKVISTAGATHLYYRMPTSPRQKLY